MNGPVQSRTCRKWAEGSPSLEHLANGKILQEKKPKGRYWLSSVQFTSVAQSCPTQRPHELQHTRPPCLSLTPRVYPNPCPSSQGCHLTISSSAVPFSSCPQSFPTSGSFQMSQLFASGGQSTGVSVSTSSFHPVSFFRADCKLT